MFTYKFFAILLLCLSNSCIEYRFDHFGEQDRYIGWVTTRPKLDPKLGSKAKMYFLPPNRINPYIGGHFSRRRLTMDVGVLYYLSKTVSLEMGYRSLMWETDSDHFGDNTGNLTWRDNDADQILYFGGRINF